MREPAPDFDCDVLICGLGPVGQLLALLLGDRGVATIAIDRADAPYDLPRAAVIDDEVLRILQAAGCDGAVLADSQVQPRASIVTAAGRAVEVLRAQTGLLGHPPLVSINQPSIERTLVAAAESRATVELRWGTALETLDRRADHVVAGVRAAAGGRSSSITARWLVGCDGAASAVRARLGIPFEGRTAPQRWVVLDALVPAPLSKVPHPHFVGARERPIVTLPMSPGRHRWEWMVHPGEDAAPFLEPAWLQTAMTPWLAPGETAVAERAVVYTFHTRTAARWRQGRVLLAGDAAHVMPPFVGQGFSSGARDASNLAWKLADVLAGAPERLLDSYEVERRPHVAAMQRTANLMGGVVQATKGRTIRARDTWLNAIDGTRAQEWLATNVKPLPTYGEGAFASRPARLAPRRTVGALFPQTGRADDALPAGWCLVTADPGTRAALAATGAATPDDGAQAAGALPVADPGADAAWLAKRGCSFAVLRPDRFVFACGPAAGVAAAVAAWRRIAPPERVLVPA